MTSLCEFCHKNPSTNDFEQLLHNYLSKLACSSLSFFPNNQSQLPLTNFSQNRPPYMTSLFEFCPENPSTHALEQSLHRKSSITSYSSHRAVDFFSSQTITNTFRSETSLKIGLH